MDTDAKLQQLRALIESRGVIQSHDLQEEFGLSQASASRLLNRSDLPLVRIGRARATRYSMLRYPFTEPLPLFRIDQGGAPEQIALVSPLIRGRYAVQPEDSDNAWWLDTAEAQLYDDLPYFLADMAPQGFLGREIARQLGAPFPADPRRWSSDNVLTYLIESPSGADTTGNLVLGEQALARAQRSPAIIHSTQYGNLANSVLAGQLPGSSAGGEHPKFTAYTKHAGHVIVKFSPREDGRVADRWRDLLIAEQIAAETLRDAGLPVTDTKLYAQDGRCMLEVARFDRARMHGRLPMLSLAQLDAEFAGPGADWVKVMESLLRFGRVSQDDYEMTLRYQWFGQWAGNSDMHLGNLSLAPDAGARRFRLLPAYDMAPMRFAPERGELPPVTMPTPPVRLPRYAQLWEQMRTLGVQYWTRVNEDSRISPDFQTIAKQCREHIGD